MPKRPSLFAETPSTREPDAAPESAAVTATPAAKGRVPSRAGKRVLTMYLDPLAWRQLRDLALDNNTSAQKLGEEAINLLFAKYGINRSA